MRNSRFVVPAVAALVMLVSADALANSETRDWEFQVLLNNKEIGYHTFSLRDEGERQILQTEARFDVKVLFINAFRYRHENIETWRNGCLAGIDATTNKNGEVLTVTGERRQNEFSVTSNTGNESLSDCVQTFAYWNPSILSSTQLLNSQTGEYEPVSITPQGDDEVAVGEQTVAAERYQLATREGDITLWYSKGDRTWLALEAPAKGGRRIRYIPVAVPESIPAESAQVSNQSAGF